MEGRSIARHDYPVVVDGNEVGMVTSGSISPTLGGAIALAYVSTEYSQIGQRVAIIIRGKENLATVVERPFYKRQ
jgi:aminomethyltransferase